MPINRKGEYQSYIPNIEIIFLEDAPSQDMSIVIPKFSSVGALNQQEENATVLCYVGH